MSRAVPKRKFKRLTMNRTIDFENAAPKIKNHCADTFPIGKFRTVRERILEGKWGGDPAKSGNSLIKIYCLLFYVVLQANARLTPN